MLSYSCKFDIEIKDRGKGTENVAADHLSQIENDESSNDSEVDDNFPRETLIEINTKDKPWFANLANYLVGDIIPKETTFSDVTLGTPCQRAMVVMIIGQWVKAGPHLSKAMHLELVLYNLDAFTAKCGGKCEPGSLNGVDQEVGYDDDLVLIQVMKGRSAQMTVTDSFTAWEKSADWTGLLLRGTMTLEMVATEPILSCANDARRASSTIKFDSGPPQSGKYDMGAICMQDHSETLQILINDALDKGAEIVVGGSVTDISEGVVDQYFPATIILIVDPR
ncbi:reverse transcriptase domain-containing protein [Tanacetum coccineum]